MKFNKVKFTKNKSEATYFMLLDFLDCEINAISLNDITFLLSLENLRSFSYEGNKYIIQKAIDDTSLLIIDEIAEEQGVSQDQARFKLSASEMLDILFEAKEILNNN